MKKLTKKITIATAFLCGGLLAGVGFANVNSATAAAAEADKFFKVQSVALRIPDKQYGEGIRFTIVMDTTTYAEENVANLTTGVLVIPSYALGSEELVVDSTNAAMMKVEGVSWTADEGVMKMYVHLYNIPDTEYATDVSIRAYVDDNDATTAPIYTDVAVSSVAKAADWLYENDDLTDEEKATLQANYLTYDVNFYNGEEIVTSIKGVYGEKITAPTTPEKEGYEFKGWWNEAGTAEWDFDNTMVGGVETNLYAKWDLVTYQATIIRADGTQQTVSFTINDRASVLAGISLTADDAQYTYAWAAELPTELALNNEQVFTETRTVNTYTVSFNTDGGSALDAQTVPYGTPASALANFSSTKVGYTFAGWTFENGSAIPESAIVQSDLTVKAKWEIITYQAKIVRADGTEQKVSFNINDRASVLASIALTANNAQYTYAWATALPTELALNNEQVFTETRTEKIYYTVNYLGADANGVYNVTLQEVTLRAESLGAQSNIDFADIIKTVNGLKYVYSAVDASQVTIDENGQVVNVNYKLTKVVDDFENLTVGAADKARFGKLAGGNIYYEAGGQWNTAEVVSTYGYGDSKSVRYYMYNSASVTLKAGMSADQLSQVGKNDTIKLSFSWVRAGGSDTATITPYIGSASGSKLTFTTPENFKWGTVTISGRELVQEFIAAGGIIAFQVDLSGSFHYVYVYVDAFEVEKGEPDTSGAYTVNYYAADGSGNYNVLLKNVTLNVDALGDESNIDFSDISTTVNGIKYVYSAVDASQVAITQDGQVVDVNYKLVSTMDSFENLTAGAADTGRFAKIDGGNIYYEGGAVFQKAEVVNTYGLDGGKSVRYYIYNSASVTLKATMSAEQLAKVGRTDTIKLSFYWIRNGGSDNATITPYIGSASGSQLAFSTPSHGSWGTLTINGKELVQEFIAAGGAIAFKVDLEGGWHYVYVYVDAFEVVKGVEEKIVTLDFESDSTTNDTYVEHAAFSGTGYLKNGGANTPYSGAYLKNIEIATDYAHSGNQALKVSNDSAAAGWGKLQIDLSEEQKAALKVGAEITLWYKVTTASTATTVNASFEFKVNGVAQDKLSCLSSNYGSAATAASQWKQVTIEVTEEMLANYSDKIVIQTSNGVVSYTDGTKGDEKTYNLWIDDITIINEN